RSFSRPCRADRRSRPSFPTRRSSDLYRVALPDLREPAPEGEDIPLDIVYEDDALLVVNKPSGMATHPSAGHETGTLVNALIRHRSEEHTSELQSRENLVCRLLLEKKK